MNGDQTGSRRLVLSQRTRLVRRWAALVVAIVVLFGGVGLLADSSLIPVQIRNALSWGENELPETASPAEAQAQPSGDQAFTDAGLAQPEGPAPRKSVAVREADVIIYGTTTAGIGAVRALEQTRESFGRELQVVLISSDRILDSPLAQGLSVEDRYSGGGLSGFYGEFRNQLIARYETEGLDPIVDGRIRYEPEVARQVLLSFVEGRQHVEWLGGELRAAEGADGKGPRYVVVEEADGNVVRINTEYFIDASVEGDLGRLLGASYMLGKGDELYNLRTGPHPAPPTPENEFVTAPQRYSFLLTLQVYEDEAPALADFEHDWYSNSTYGPDFEFAEHHRDGFATSWSLRHVLPHGKRELNEVWSDYPGPQASFDWVLFPEKRPQLRELMVSYVLDKVRYLQEHGYQEIGVVNVPSRPYVRDGARFKGLDFYTGDDIDSEAVDNPVAHGVYARYDRHDLSLGSLQDSRAAEVFVPMGALLPEKHPYLVVPTAISADESAICSAVRMEPVRANMGGAAGVMVAAAAREAIDVHQLEYGTIREELERQGYELN